jgi:hypothetical protein
MPKDTSASETTKHAETVISAGLVAKLGREPSLICHDAAIELS